MGTGLDTSFSHFFCYLDGSMTTPATERQALTQERALDAWDFISIVNLIFQHDAGRNWWGRGSRKITQSHATQPPTSSPFLASCFHLFKHTTLHFALSAPRQLLQQPISNHSLMYIPIQHYPALDLAGLICSSSVACAKGLNYERYKEEIRLLKA